MMAASSVAPAAAISSTTTPPPPPAWSSLLPDILGEIFTHLRPVDIACFRVVCRAWHSAAHQHGHHRHEQQQLPWVVLPDGSFGTMSGDFFHRIPGVPDNVTCLGATGSWLALDRTEDVFRRTNRWDTYDDTTSKFLEPRRDVRHKHSYMLYNPFSSKILPLPKLDSVAGDVSETFEIRKVLMRRSSASCTADNDDLVVVTTNRWNHAILIFRSKAEKEAGMIVIPHVLGVWDVTFFQNALYGITEHEDLVVFDLGKNDDGDPIVSGLKRVIIGRRPLADGKQDPLSWMDDYQPINDELSDDDDDKATTEYNVDDVMIVGDDTVIVNDEEVPCGTKEYIATTRRLMESCTDQDLLMVRHQEQTPPLQPPYTRKVDIFKADMDAGQWVSITATALAQGEALFLSRSTSRVTQAYGDIKDGFVYSIDINDAFDIRSGTRSPSSLPWQRKCAAGELLIWFFPPRLVL